MTTHELANILLAEPAVPVHAWDPDSAEWEEVTGVVTHEGQPTRIYTDDIS